MVALRAIGFHPKAREEAFSAGGNILELSRGGKSGFAFLDLLAPISFVIGLVGLSLGFFQILRTLLRDRAVIHIERVLEVETIRGGGEVVVIGVNVKNVGIREAFSLAAYLKLNGMQNREQMAWAEGGKEELNRIERVSMEKMELEPGDERTFVYAWTYYSVGPKQYQLGRTAGIPTDQLRKSMPALVMMEYMPNGRAQQTFTDLDLDKAIVKSKHAQ